MKLVDNYNGNLRIREFKQLMNSSREEKKVLFKKKKQ